MKKWRIYFIMVILLCISIKLSAQWESSITQYWQVKGYYNPSYAGISNSINTNAIYKYKVAGIDEAPHQFVLTADMPLYLFNKRHGVGFIFYTESIDRFRNSLFASQYSFKQQIGKGFLNIGFQAGIYQLKYDAGTINTFTNSNQNNYNNINLITNKKGAIDINAGISWTANRFYVGLSALHVNKPVFYVSNVTGLTDNSFEYPSNNSSDSLKSYISQSFILTAGYNIPLFNSFEIQPMILLLSNRNHAYTHTAVQLEYNNLYSFGFSWISKDEYSIFAGTTFQDLGLGYAYTIHTSGYDKASKGSHELYLKYNLPLDSFKPRLQPHKSIRFL